MKLRDAARVGKATEAFIERIQAAAEKLDAREAAVLKALESLAAINESVGESFAKWNDLLQEVDGDDELGGAGEAPSFDVDNLVEAIGEAFSSARDELLSEVEDYEAVVQAAADYVEPEEEDEDEGEEFVFTCDHPGCKESTELDMTQAREAGWEIWSDRVGKKITWTSFCPKHRR